MGRQGLAQSCNGSRATEDFSWVSINWKNLFLFLVWFSLLNELIHACSVRVGKRVDRPTVNSV